MKKASFLLALILVSIGYWLLVIWGFPLAWGVAARLTIPGIVGWLFALALAWAVQRININLSTYAGVLILGGLLFPTAGLMAGSSQTPLSLVINMVLFWLPPVALVAAAILLYSSLNSYYKEQQNVTTVTDSQASLNPAHRFALITLILSFLIIIKTIHNLYWLTVWDNTYDPLEYIWLIVPILAVFFSGVMLFIALPGRMKLAGILYSLLIPALMILVSTYAQRVDFRQSTEKRAEQTIQALEAYYAREGHYPQNLQQLTPRYILSLPKPMIIYAQDWCYESGEDYYRLGYVDREHWSDPRLIGRIYKAKGEAHDLHRMCEEEVTAIQAHDPGYPYTYWKESE